MNNRKERTPQQKSQRNDLFYQKKGHFIYGLILCASIFTKELFGRPIAGSIVDLYLIAVAGWGIVVSCTNAFVWGTGVVWAGLLFLSFLLSQSYGFPSNVLLKQGVVAAFVYMGCAGLLRRTDSRSLLKAYQKVVLVAACFGLLQWVVSLGGVMILMKVRGRLDSFAYEPSHYAIAIGPAFYLAARKLIETRKFHDWKSWIVILNMALTVSMTGVVIALYSCLLLFFRRNGLIVALFIGVACFCAFTQQQYLPESIRDRIQALEEAADEDNVSRVTNLSVFSPLSNWEVAFETLRKGRWLGNGIGGHSFAYEEHFGTIGTLSKDRYGTNSIGAHSLFIRVFSELGLIGMGFYFFWIVRGGLAAVRERDIWWTLSAVYLVGRVVKLGGFFELGLPIFILAPLAFHGLNQRRVINMKIGRYILRNDVRK